MAVRKKKRERRGHFEAMPKPSSYMPAAFLLILAGDK